MFQLILKKKAFYFALLGFFLTILVVVKSGQTPQPSKPLVEPVKNPFSRAIAASGIVESINENSRVAPAVSGLVKNIYVVSGQKVKKGDLLFDLDDRQLYGQYLVQKANYEKLLARSEKVKSLPNPRYISKDERDNILNDYRIAEAELKRTDLLLDQLKVKSPFDSVILQVNIRPGEFVSTPLGTTSGYEPPILLGNESGIQIRADIDEINAHLIKPESRAKAFLKGFGNQPGIDLKLARIEPYVIPKRSLTGDNLERVDTRVLQVIFQAVSSQKIYVGQQLDVYIEY